MKRLKVTCGFVVIILVVLLSGCGKKNTGETAQVKEYTSDHLTGETKFTIDQDNYQSQPYWNVINHPASKGENGYYYNNLGFLYFFDSTTKAFTVLCNKPDCYHTAKDNCNAYLQNCSGNIYYANGALYTFRHEDTDVYLIKIAVDGSGMITELSKIGAYDKNDFGGWQMVIHDQKAYVYNRKQYTGEYETDIIEYDLNGKDSSNIVAFFYGDQIYYSSVKGYGSKLFYIPESTAVTENNIGISIAGVYSYDYNSKTTALVLEGNIKDFTIDETNNLIYYYVVNDGLYCKNLSEDQNHAIKIYNADDDTEFCQISYDGHYLYVNNENYVGLASEAGIKKQNIFTLVLSPDGTIVNKIDSQDEYDTLFGDDQYLFTRMRRYIEKSNIETATLNDYIPLLGTDNGATKTIPTN